MFFTIIFLVAIQAVDSQTAGEGDIWNQIPLKKVTEIQLPPSTLGGKWKASPGLKIDDLSALSDVPATSRQAAKDVAKQLKPLAHQPLSQGTHDRFQRAARDQSLSSICDERGHGRVVQIHRAERSLLGSL